MTLKLTDGRGLPARQRRKASDDSPRIHLQFLANRYLVRVIPNFLYTSLVLTHLNIVTLFYTPLK